VLVLVVLVLVVSLYKKMGGSGNSLVFLPQNITEKI
jgi:hypothetical protein